jgi:SAM-dependent methyltransferase
MIKRCSPEIPNINFYLSGFFLAGLIFFFTSKFKAQVPYLPFSTYQMITGDQPHEDQARWSRVYRGVSVVYRKEVSGFLLENVQFLQGERALDIAAGEGNNAVFLAKKGFQVDALDLSEVAVRKAKRLAKSNQLNINVFLADIHSYHLESEKYDVIVGMEYWEKSTVPKLMRSLKPGGVLFLEKHASPNGFVLKKGAFQEVVQKFEILVYHETTRGKNSKLSLLLRKPLSFER